jgi:hypothetical protein
MGLIMTFHSAFCHLTFFLRRQIMMSLLNHFIILEKKNLKFLFLLRRNHPFFHLSVVIDKLECLTLASIFNQV